MNYALGTCQTCLRFVSLVEDQVSGILVSEDPTHPLKTVSPLTFDCGVSLPVTGTCETCGVLIEAVVPWPRLSRSTRGVDAPVDHLHRCTVLFDAGGLVTATRIYGCRGPRPYPPQSSVERPPPGWLAAIAETLPIVSLTRGV